MAEPLDSLVAAYHLLAADFALAAASHRPDYSIDGVSVSRDQWLDRMLSKLKALREEILANGGTMAPEPFSYNARVWSV